MNRWERIDSATLPNGDVVTLDRRGEEYVIRVAGFELMSSRQHGSEELLAELAIANARVPRIASVLVGGLGMGFTLRAVLELLPADAHVTVAELLPEVVKWNETHLGDLAGQPLDDPRVTVVLADVADLLRGSADGYDLILLDTDNGPEGTTQDANEWLYGAAGLAATRSSLRPGGVLAVWSTFPSETFTKRLTQAGYNVETHFVRSRGKKGNRHVIWVARRSMRAP